MDKHRKYNHAYVKNDLYWGIGIENELYLDIDRPSNPTNILNSNKFTMNDVNPVINP